MKAADEGSPGTTTRSSSSSSTWATVIRSPSRSNGTRARRSMRSVWSRLTEASATVVEPPANMPAISTQDFTWALAIGSSYSMPLSSAPRTVKGGKRSSRASTLAPIAPQRLGDAVDRAAADRLVAVERPYAARLSREPARQQPHERPGVAHVQEPARRLERRVQAHAAEQQAVLALLLDARAERPHGVQGRARVLGVEVVDHRYGLVRHRSEQRRPVGDRLVGRGRVLAPERAGGVEADGRAHSLPTGKPSASISSRARAAWESPAIQRLMAPVLMSDAGASAMSTMFTPALPSSSATWATIPGRFGTVMRNS